MTRCQQLAKHHPIKVKWRLEPLYFACDLEKGHKGKHIAYADKEVVEEWS